MNHKMKLQLKYYDFILNGTKRIEIRLNDEKRQLLKVNDFIEFTNITNNEKLLVKIENLYYFSSFEELYKNLDKTLIGYDSYEIANPKDMEEYYSVEKQKQYGVVGIKIKKKRIY